MTSDIPIQRRAANLPSATRSLMLSMCIYILLGSHHGLAAPVVSNIHDFSAPSGYGMQGVTAWRFDVIDPVHVTALGYWDRNQDGLSISHRVGLWSPGGQLLASATVPSGTSASLEENFRMVSITPTRLAPGIGYTVGTEIPATNPDYLMSRSTTDVFDPRIAWTGQAYTSLASGFTQPTWDPTRNGFPLFGASFSIEGVPEPSSCFLLAIGTLAVGTAARRGR